MHPNSLRLMAGFRAKRLAADLAGVRVLDVGSWYDGHDSYRPTFEGSAYTGLDTHAGPGVDVVGEPYAYPFPDGSFDVVICGQMLEHCPRPWRAVPEMARVLRPGGLICLIAPWSWEPHYFPVDCWRILPDGMVTLLADAGLNVLECSMSENDTMAVARRGGPLKVELGGGRSPRPGFVNVDLVPGPGVDVVINFEQLAQVGQDGTRLPFADDSVEELYSSHCLEHVAPYQGFLHEIVRVCRVGAAVEIRVPHWLSDMAHCAGHKHALAPRQIQHWCRDFIADWWTGCKKRLAHVRTEYLPSSTFAEAKALFWQLSDEQVMRFIPDACHEVRFFFEVIAHAG